MNLKYTRLVVEQPRDTSFVEEDIERFLRRGYFLYKALEQKDRVMDPREWDCPVLVDQRDML